MNWPTYKVNTRAFKPESACAGVRTVYTTHVNSGSWAVSPPEDWRRPRYRAFGYRAMDTYYFKVRYRKLSAGLSLNTDIHVLVPLSDADWRVQVLRVCQRAQPDITFALHVRIMHSDEPTSGQDVWHQVGLIENRRFVPPYGHSSRI